MVFIAGVMPEKGWRALSIREDVYNLIMEKAREAGLTVNEYLKHLASIELTVNESSGKLEASGLTVNQVESSKCSSELTVNSTTQLTVNDTVSKLCDEIVQGVAFLVRAYGYTFHAGLLVELYKSRKTSAVLSRREYLNKGIDVSHLSDVSRLVFDISPVGLDNYELSVKFWLKPCFAFKQRP